MNRNYAAWYFKITKKIRKDPNKVKALNLFSKIYAYLFYIAYPLLLIYIFLYHKEAFLKCVFVPGISFILVSIIRSKINIARPYEKEPIVPLIYKATAGHSFPSRHAFSSAVISMVFLYISVPFGIVCLCICILGSCIRVLGGIHYPRDVIAGMCIGILCGLFLWL